MIKHTKGCLILSCLLVAAFLILPFRSACCETDGVASLSAEITALLKLKGTAYFEKRKEIVKRWTPKVESLSALKEKLSPIHAAVVGGIVARIRYPELMVELDEKHLKALNVLANPPVIYRDNISGNHPQVFPDTIYYMKGTSRWEGTQEHLTSPSIADYHREAFAEYYDSICLPGSRALFPFLIELLGTGTRFELQDGKLKDQYAQYGDVARWKGLWAIRELSIDVWAAFPHIPMNLTFPHKLMNSVCHNTGALDSPGFFSLAVKFAVGDRKVELYHLLAEPHRQEMVRRTKILGDPDREFPPMSEDSLYHKYFREIVKYADEHPVASPSPVPIPVPATPLPRGDERGPSSNNNVTIYIVAALALVALALLLLWRKRR